MYTKKDFDNLQFNPMVGGMMTSNYPKLLEIVSTDMMLDDELDAIVRYTVMIYDPKSIVVTQEKDMNYRKGIAADLAGLNQDELYREHVFNFTNKNALNLALRYLTRFVRSREFAALCAVEFKFWESIKKLLSPIDEGSSKAELEAVQKKATISDEIDKDLSRLDKYYKEFFGDDNTLMNIAKEKRWTPESIGKKKISNV